MKKILLVGGNKRQKELLDRHFNMKAVDFRHIFQSSSKAPSVPKGCDAVIIWTKHCTHKLENSVVADMGDYPGKFYKADSSTELLNVFIDVLGVKSDAHKLKKVKHNVLNEEVAVPSAMLRTGHRLDGLMASMVVEETGMTPEKLKEYHEQTEECKDCGADIPPNVDGCICEEHDEDEDPSFIGGAATELPKENEPIHAPDCFPAKLTVLVSIEDNTGDEIASRNVTTELDGSVIDLPMLISSVARSAAESTGWEALENINRGRSDPAMNM